MDHLDKVTLKSPSFKKFEKIAPKDFDKIARLSHPLKNKKVIHINSTQLGGGVSVLLRSQVPLEQSLGINSQWYIIKAPLFFFEITKKIHNLLQGEKGQLTKGEKSFYLDWLYGQIAISFKELIAKEKPDVIIIHDPQPLPLIEYIPDSAASALRLHIDLSHPNPNILSFLRPLMKKYRLTIISHPSYRPKWMNLQSSRIIMPAINPFTAKNKTIALKKAKEILGLYHIDASRPLVSQVSRFDPWKDPLGVFKAYQKAKKEIPQLQLVLAGIMQAQDDPQAEKIFQEIKRRAKNDKDVFLFAYPKHLKGVSNDLFINAVYTASQVIMQKSLREGFGLTVTEAMWKGKPVIGGNAKGISLQIEHGRTGYLVNSFQEAAQCLIDLLKNPRQRKIIGEAAKKSVRENFLVSRLVADHLSVYQELLSK